MPTYDFYASGALDITKPAKEMLIERVNAINGLRYDPEQFVLSAVVKRFRQCKLRHIRLGYARDYFSME